MGCLTNIIAGMLGAIVGGWIFSIFGGGGFSGFNLTSLIVATAGAVIVLAIVNLLFGRDSKSTEVAESTESTDSVE